MRQNLQTYTPIYQIATHFVFALDKGSINLETQPRLFLEA